MRVEELCRLKLRDCAGGLFRIRGAKTEAGNRDVPIHPDLEPIIRQRSKGRGAGDYLIHEIPEPRIGSAKERSQVKRFTRYRRGLNLDERPNGQRQSRIDMHSLRRWFADKATIALEGGATSFTPNVISEVLGHVKPGQTSHYAGQRPELARRACVKSVQLPIEARKAIGCP